MLVGDIMKDKKGNDWLKNLALITQIGISMLSPILLGLFIGIKLDKYFQNNYLFSIIFLILGIGSGFMNVFKLLNIKDDSKRK